MPKSYTSKSPLIFYINSSKEHRGLIFGNVNFHYLIYIWEIPSALILKVMSNLNHECLVPSNIEAHTVQILL